VSSKGRNITIEDLTENMSNFSAEEEPHNWIHMDFLKNNEMSIKDQVKQINREINQRYTLMTQIHNKNKKMSAV
jgi:hypothetical protein